MSEFTENENNHRKSRKKEEKQIKCHAAHATVCVCVLCVVWTIRSEWNILHTSRKWKEKIKRRTQYTLHTVAVAQIERRSPGGRGYRYSEYFYVYFYISVITFSRFLILSFSPI